MLTQSHLPRPYNLFISWFGLKQELSVQTKLPLNSQRSANLGLLRAGIEGICHHTWQTLQFLTTKYIYIYVHVCVYVLITYSQVY